MIHYVVPSAQDHSVREYLDWWGRDMSERMRVTHYEGLPDRSRFEAATYVLTGLEYLSPAMLRLVTEVRRQLEGRPGFRFLNDPRRTLRRYDLLTALHDRGSNTFRVARAGGDLGPLRYPVFLRAETSHDGAVSPLLWSRQDVHEALGRAIVTGRQLHDLIVVEFCDTADAEGGYRKYAAFVVGDRVLARSLEFGSHWMLKHETCAFSPELASEELAFVSTNPHREALAEIRAIAGVGYGRIDYALKDGRVEVWEINLCPVIGRGRRPSRRPKTAETQAVRRQTKERFYDAFRAAFEAVDSAATGAAAVDLDPAIVRAARAAARSARPRANRLVRWLEPVRPVLDPLAARVFPVLGRLARRAEGRRSAADPAPAPKP